MKLSLARTALAAVVREATSVDVAVKDHLPDQIAVPCVLVAWGDPMLKPSTLCAYEAAMELLIIAQRIEPGGRLETLEEIIGDLIPAVKSMSGYTVRDVTSPYPIQFSGVDYLATSINIIHDLDD